MERVRFLFFFVLLAFGLLVHAQNISVKSFQPLPMDLAASSLEGKRTDQNGEVAALIKVVTTQTGFTFEGGALGIVDSQQRNGEIWVWVPRGLRKITILHQQLGVLRDYRFPVEIEAERTYEMVLTTAKIETVIKEEVRQQYLVFELEPKNATLEVNDQLWSVNADGTALQFVDFGTYTYRVRAANYETDAGVVTVDDPDNPKTVKVKLKSNFAEVTFKVDTDAEIWVNNEKKGIRTWTGSLGKGTYKIECKQDGHEASMISKEITSEMNGQTITLPMPKPIYGSLNVESTPIGATVFIDGKETGKTPKSFNDVLVGQHEIRLSKDNYRDYVETVDITKETRKLVKAMLSDEDSSQMEKQRLSEYNQFKKPKKKKSGSFGIKLCSGLDWISSTTGAANNEGVQIGYGVGVMAGYYFTKRFAIVTGVNVDFVKGHYSFDDMRNLSAVDTITDYQLGTIDRQFKTTIYEIPLMLKMVTPELGGLPLRAYAQVGGAFGYTQRVKVMDTFTLGDLNDKDYRATDGEYNPFHASLRIGAGAEYALLETTRVFAGIYFSHDFLNSISRGALVTSNYEKYYAGNKDLGERDLKLNVLQNRIGIEMGIFF